LEEEEEAGAEKRMRKALMSLNGLDGLNGLNDLRPDNTLTIQIIARLMPLVNEVREVPYGYLVPVAAITVFSFPPLFGSGE
jgi:hypothetical protein